MTDENHQESVAAEATDVHSLVWYVHPHCQGKRQSMNINILTANSRIAAFNLSLSGLILHNPRNNYKPSVSG